MSKYSGTNVIKSPNDRSVWNENSPQEINLGWIDSSTYRKLCSTLSSSYRHGVVGCDTTKNDAETL